MSEDQKKAITQLRRAMSKCQKEGVHVFGMDYEVYGVSKKAVRAFKSSGEKSMYGDSDAAAYQWASNNDLQDETSSICTFGGCGGW